MKKKSWWIYLPFVALLATFLSIYFAKGLQMPTHSSIKRELTYAIPAQATAMSVAPSDSDIGINAAIMEHLVGTLVKYSGSGRYEPYLAEKWDVSDDGLSWTFWLRKGLTAEDGTPITAHGFRLGLLKSLRIYAKQADAPVFSELAGWKEFLAGSNDLEGVKALSGEGMVFRFAKRTSGLLPFLAMPYFGFYAEANFQNEAWKDRTRIISSGPYQLRGPLPETSGDVFLDIRNDWPMAGQFAPTSVRIHQFQRDRFPLLDPRNLIIVHGDTTTGFDPAKFTPVVGTPTILTAAVLSPVRKGPFHDRGVRSIFGRTLARACSRIDELPSGLQRVEAFYGGLPVVHSGEGDESGATTPSHSAELIVTIPPNMRPAERKLIEQSLTEAAKHASLKLRFDTEDRSRPDWIERRSTNLHADVRIQRVDIGGNIQNWVIRMMFCSKLGVSFPDPSGRICALTKRMEEEALDEREYETLFSSILAEDAAVIPLFHSGITWLFSKDIPLDEVTPTMNVPRFDQLKLKH
jgi:hypothetical protein